MTENFTDERGYVLDPQSKSSSAASEYIRRMPAWLAPGQAEEWMKADADGAMAMLLATDPPPMARLNRCQARERSSHL